MQANNSPPTSGFQQEDGTSATLRAPFPTVPALAIPQLIAILLIAFKGSRLLRLAFLLAYTTYGAHVCFSGKYTTGDELQDYSMGNAVSMQVLVYIALFWCLEDSAGKKHVIDVVRHEDDSADKKTPGERGILSRVYWAFSLLQSSRFVGWSTQVKNIPEPRSYGRLRFISVSILRCIEYYLILDFGIWYLHRPNFIYGPGAPSIADQPFLERCLTVLLEGAAGYCTINLYYTVLGLVCVSTGVSEPKRWPKLFGRWRDTYTLRKFWGSTWHQMLRRFIAPITSSITSTLSISHGTRFSSNFHLILGFALSTIVHVSGDASVGTPWKESSAIFFPMQAFAIMFEDLIIELFNGGRNKPNRLGGLPLLVAHVVGYVWVFMWFVFSLPFFIDAQMRARVGEARAIPAEWSIVERLMN